MIEFLKQSNAIEGVYDSDSLNQAIYAWDYILQQAKMSVSSILKCHKILMLNHNLRPNEKGYFRRVGVRIGASYGAEWHKVPNLMAQWVKQANFDKTCEQIKQSHIKFEKIHPFIDGNGRTGRILLNWARIKNGYDILVIKEKEKWDYYKWFKIP